MGGSSTAIVDASVAKSKKTTLSKTRLNFLFWNVHGAGCAALVADLAAERGIDIVALAEDGEKETVLGELRGKASGSFFEPVGATSKIDVFGRSKELGLSEVYADPSRRLSVRTVQFEGFEFLLGLVHLVDPRSWNDGDQAAEASLLADAIRSVEKERENKRTIVVGDFNMNPFSQGMVNASGLHGVMTKSIARSSSRTVQGRDYPFFFNPMWGFFGDGTPGPPGTIYYRDPGHFSVEWNIFDQVLVRPEVFRWFEDVTIVSKIGKVELGGRDDRPKKKQFSDHFPIVFSLAAED